MKKNREDLEKMLMSVIQSLSSSRKVRSELSNKFAQHGILSGTVEDILKGLIVLKTLPVPLLCLICKYLYEATDDGRINYNNFFTEFEIQQAEAYKNENRKEESDVIVFENITRDAEDDFSGVITIKQNADMWEQMLFRYNPETQRPLIIKDFIGGEYKEPFLSTTSRNQITKRILAGKQIANTITINVLDDGNNDINYEESSRQLVVHGKCDLIDGYHRSLAAWFAYQSNPNLDFYFKLRIVKWQVDQAKEFIYQESLGTKLNPLKAKSYNTVSFAHKVVTKINKDNKCNLSGLITDEENFIEQGKALVLFNTLFNGIRILNPNIKDDDNRKIVELQKFYVDGFNIITEHKTELLESPVDNRFWLACLIIINKYGENEEQITKAIDLLNLNDLMNIPMRTINKKAMDSIEKYIVERMKANV